LPFDVLFSGKAKAAHGINHGTATCLENSLSLNALLKSLKRQGKKVI